MERPCLRKTSFKRSRKLSVLRGGNPEKMTKAVGAVNWKDPVYFIGILLAAAVILSLFFCIVCAVFGITLD